MPTTVAGRAKDGKPRVGNVSGGLESAFSLAELSAWCEKRFGRKHEVVRDGSERPLDLPWLVLDDAMVRKEWDWKPAMGRGALFEEVANFAEANPTWMSVSAG
jgi:CDP-paratose 2-epimerase